MNVYIKVLNGRSYKYNKTRFTNDTILYYNYKFLTEIVYVNHLHYRFYNQ